MLRQPSSLLLFLAVGHCCPSVGCRWILCCFEDLCLHRQCFGFVVFFFVAVISRRGSRGNKDLRPSTVRLMTALTVWGSTSEGLPYCVFLTVPRILVVSVRSFPLYRYVSAVLRFPQLLRCRSCVFYRCYDVGLALSATVIMFWSCVFRSFPIVTHMLPPSEYPSAISVEL
jgi:hypothetical protein